MGAGRRGRRGVRLRTADLLAAACVIVGLTAPSALAARASGAAHARPDRGYGVSPVTEVSTCGGYNAEVVQAVGKPSYIYETWIGCGGEGFARSTDGGLHFQKPITLPDSSFSDDPAIAVAPSGTLYVSYLRYHQGYAYPVVAASFAHRATFSQVTSLIPHVKGNWGDRDFIAVGRNGTVYVTWDYGRPAAAGTILCTPTG